MVTLPKGGYKKPKRINRVSVTFFLIFCGMVYVGYSFWPVLALRANVGAVLDDFVPLLYRANIVPEPQRTERIAGLKGDVIKKVKAVPGLHDPKFVVTVRADRLDDKKKGEKIVKITVEYHTFVVFEGIDKTYPITIGVSSQTDAARVDWD